MCVLVHLITTILEQLEVNGLIHLYILFIKRVDLILIIPLIKHLGHRLVV